jgi:hypothetical protein
MTKPQSWPPPPQTRATDTRHSANAIDSRIVILLKSPLNGLDKGT